MSAPRSPELVGFGAEDRVVVLAPHPDDEVISSGLLICRALEAGASVTVVILTHGDAFGYTGPNPVARGTAFRRRTELGRVRCRESRRALHALGVADQDILFLGYPDRGLAALWTTHWRVSSPFRSPFTRQARSPYSGCYTPGAVYAGESLLGDLKAILAQTRPTVLVHPHPRDAHGDHWAAAGFARAALEESRHRGADWAVGCRSLLYVVHRGGWPVPRGFHAGLKMLPPPAIGSLGGNWLQVPGTPEFVRKKRQALSAYRTQMPLLGRFLQSFVRASEAFEEGAHLWASPLPAGSLLLGADVDLWEGFAAIADPVGDSVTRQFERGADLASISLACDRRQIYIRLLFADAVRPDIEYRIQLFDCPRERAMVLRFRPPTRVSFLEGSRFRLARSVVGRTRRRSIELAFSGALLDYPESLFVNVETRLRRIVVDRTGVHHARLPRWEAGSAAVTYAVATPGEIASCANLFMEAFRESILHIFGVMPSPRLVQQVFRLAADAEPDALLVALLEGKVVGYVYAPTSLRHVWWTALARGHVFRWFLGWIGGRYRLGLAPLRVLLLDKIHFVRSSVGGPKATEARILSIAVHPEHQGLGIGSRLVRHALDRFRRQGVPRVRLEVRPSNGAAVRVYEKMGFQVRGKTQDSRGEWLIMLLDLEPTSS